jgi:PAS domain S-box-containing protein
VDIQIVLTLSLVFLAAAAVLIVRLVRLRRDSINVIGAAALALLAIRPAYLLIRPDARASLILELAGLGISVLAVALAARVLVLAAQLRGSRGDLEQQVEARTAELAQAEQAVRASEERMRLVVQNLPVMVVALDDNQLFLVWNRECERVTGYSAAEMVNNPQALELLYPDPAYRQWMMTTARDLGSDYRDLEFTLTRKDGREHIIAWSDVSDSYPVPGWRIWAMGIDVTERKRSEAALREAQGALEQRVDARTAELRAANEHLQHEILERERAETAQRRSQALIRTTLDALDDVVHMVDRDLRITLVNEMFRRWNQDLGLETNAIGRTPFELFPFLPETVRNEYERVFETGELVATQEATQVGSVEIITETRKIPVFDGDQVTHVVTVMRDITEQTKAERTRRENEERLRIIADHVTDIVWQIDLTGKLLFITPSVERVLGYTVDEAMALAYFDALSPRSREPATRDLKRYGATDGTAPQIVEREFVCKDGSTKWCEATARVVTDANGTPTGLIGVTRDISERRRAEAALRDSEERFRSLVSSMDDIVFTLDTDQRHTGVYGRWLERDRLSPDAFLGKTAREVLGEVMGQTHQEANARALAGEPVVYEWSLEGSSGARYYQTSLSPMRDAEGNVTGLVGLGRDITALKQAERETLQLAIEQERSAILSNFIRDTTHEFANPLSVIKNSLYLAARADDRDECRARLDRVTGQVLRIEKLIDGMMTMSRLDGGIPFKFEAVDLNRLLEALRESLERVAERKGQTLALDLNHDLPPIRADQWHLRLALVNLIENAIAYTPEGGAITIRSDWTEDHVIVEVRDTGIGIAPEHVEHIFHRFFRVDGARTERGVGLGLPIARIIIERHQGAIGVESAPGAGSVFRVVLPINGGA